MPAAELRDSSRIAHLAWIGILMPTVSARRNQGTINIGNLPGSGRVLPVVIGKSARFLLVIGISISTFNFANQEVTSKIDADAAARLIDLEDAAEICSDKREAADISVSFEDVRGLNLSRNELLNALFYLSLRNGYACSEPALKELVFAVALKERIHETYGKPSANILEVLSKLAFPRAEHFEMELEYLKLAEPARRHLEGIFGTEPFDVNKVLKKLPEIQ